MELIEDCYTTEVVDESTYLHRVTDKDGNKMTYRFYDGHRYILHFPKNCPKMIEAIANMKCREDDILLATYPKSGLHWLTNVVGMLVSGTTEYTGSPPYIEFDENIEKYEDVTSPRILSTHIAFELLPREILQGNKGKIINISRNPKDVATSLYTFLQKLPFEPVYEGTLDGFLKYFLREDIICDGWFIYYKKLESIVREWPNTPILTLRYEEMKRDFYGHIQKISNFLGYKHSEDFLKQIEERCSFQSMKNGALKKSEEFETVLPIYRKGDIGDWKNWFTVAQNELFDAVYSEKMSGIDADFQYF